MQKSLSLLSVGFFLLLSDGAYAHDGLFAHPETSMEVVHAFMHMLMLLPVAAVVFFLSRWLLRRNQQSGKRFSANKR